MHVFHLSSNFCLALFSATRKYITASENCGSFPFYGRPLRNPYAVTLSSTAHSPRFMSCAEYSIVKIRTGCVNSSLTSRNSQPRAQASPSSTQCSTSPARPLRCPGSRRLHSPATTDRSLSDLWTNSLRPLREMSRVATVVVHSSAPLIVLSAVTRQPIWVCGICTRGSARHLSSWQSLTSSPMNA